ncbi:hypothetical protein [Endozoicomonas sp. 4G]|uniref:hypothetical protein n=1 Tax=Endozoicomonas sp. 4G TaxID=2872754 RepID=UPI002078B7E1|nr:hypothetical protein [Endozoicomonas sp. 4G]
MHFYRSLTASVAFVLLLLATLATQLCYSSTIIGQHNPDGHKVRIEVDFLDTGQLTDVDFWNTLLQRTAIFCPASESLQWQLSCFKQFLESTALKTTHGGGLKAGNGDGEPSGRTPDKESKNENNNPRKGQRPDPEGQESKTPGDQQESLTSSPP